MTAILGYWNHEAIWLAADRQQSWDNGEAVNLESHKIHRIGRCLLASSGSSRVGTLIELHQGKLEAQTAGGALGLAEGFRNLLIEDQWRSDATKGPLSLSYSLMIADPINGLFFVSGEGAVTVLRKNLACGFGSGGTWAEGAATALLGVGVKTEDALRWAIRVASQYDPSSGGEPDVEMVAMEGVAL